MIMGDTEGQGGGASGENIPEIELIIKASTVDGRRKGACLFCQVKKVNMYILKNIFLACDMEDKVVKIQ